MTKDERQEVCIQKWKASKGRGILELCTGFGKTRCALKIMKRMLVKKEGAKFIVIVPTEYLKGQWTLQLAEWNLLHSTNVVIINSAIGEDKNLSCDLLILDEVHEYCNDNRMTLFKTIKYRYLLGLSATLERLDGLEKNLYKYMPIIDTITVTEGLANDWIAKCNEYKVLLKVDLEEYKEAHQTFVHHFSFFDFNFPLAMKAVEDFKYRFAIAKQLNKTVKEVTVHAMQFIKSLSARKKFVLEHERKVEVARLIIEHRKDKKIITFSQTKSMAESVGTGMVMHSGMTKKQKDKIMQMFNWMECGVLNSAKALERGADIGKLSVAINLAFNRAKGAKKQKAGRITRKEGDKEAEFFTLVIQGTMEEAWYQESMNGTPYITIDEDQLLALLKGEVYKPKKEKEKEYLFTI